MTFVNAPSFLSELSPPVATSWRRFEQLPTSCLSYLLCTAGFILELKMDLNSRQEFDTSCPYRIPA